MVVVDLFFAIVRRTPSQLFSKLSWDNETSASADSSLGQRNKPAGAICGENSNWQIIFMPLPPFEVLT
jgi:hypothetical protein